MMKKKIECKFDVETSDVTIPKKQKKNHHENAFSKDGEEFLSGQIFTLAFR